MKEDSWEKLQAPIGQGGIGITSAKQANAAYLTKLGWRMLTEPNALWTRVLRAKYCKGRCDVDMFEAKAGMSNVWRGITENAKVLGEGIRTAIGNGENTLFWDHKWCSNKPLSELAIHPIPEDILGATVAEMWEEGGGWKWCTFSPYLDADTLKMIQSHELRVDPSVGDLMYWEDGTKGKFTIRSAVRIMKHETEVVDEECWNLVWRAPMQQRIRAFLWLACHDRILGNLNRFKRNFTNDPACYICGEREESTIHILRDCPAAKVVWRKTLTPDVSHKFFQGDLKEWITMNLKDPDVFEEESWVTYFGVAVWWIWRWRNSFVFNRRDEMPIDFAAFLQVRYEEARRALRGEMGEDNNAAKNKIETHISWQAPGYGWYSLNCDGAAKGNPGPAGGGAIIRDYSGAFVSACASNFGYCSAFRAEVLALTRGLELAKNLQITKLEVQIDNLACVQALKRQDVPRGENVHELRYCRNLLSDPRWETRVAHIYREGNRAADWLANRGVTQDSQLVYFSYIPVELSRILEEDSRGVALPRFIPP